MPFPAAKPSRTPLVLAALAAAALLVGLFFVLKTSDGGLVVTVAGTGGQPLDAVEVLVDGQSRCKASPCKLEEVPAGTHMVRARADGYQETADTAVVVTGGEDAVHNIKLVKASGTGVRVSAEGPGLVLFVDGREVGPLPQELKDMTPGEHKLRVEGEQFEPHSENVVIVANEMKAIGPLRLKVVKGLAHIRGGSGADGANIVLEAGGEKRQLPALPIDLHIETAKPHTLIATRKGYETFREEVTFEDGKAEREFVIELEPEADEDDSSSTAARVGGGRRVPRPPSGDPVEEERPASSGQATLSINSIPASKVILNGRPLGTTPKVGIKVSPGSHTVMFVRDGERKTKTVTVGAGEKKTVVERFK